MAPPLVSISETPSLKSPQSLVKSICMRANSLFSHLNLDVRHMIYDYIEVKSTVEWSGFILSCRQAKEEVDTVMPRLFHEYLQNLQKQLEAILDYEPTILTPKSDWSGVFAGTKTLVIALCLPDILESCLYNATEDKKIVAMSNMLSKIPWRKIRIHYNSYEGVRETYIYTGEEVWDFYREWVRALEPLPLQRVREITISWDLLEESEEKPKLLEGFGAVYCDKYQNHCIKKFGHSPDQVWPRLEELESADDKVGWKSAVMVPKAVPKILRTEKLFGMIQPIMDKYIDRPAISRAYEDIPW